MSRESANWSETEKDVTADGNKNSKESQISVPKIPPKFCPDCSAKGKQAELVGRKINLTEAVLCCPCEDCPYPLNKPDEIQFIDTRPPQDWLLQEAVKTRASCMPMRCSIRKIEKQKIYAVRQGMVRMWLSTMIFPPEEADLPETSYTTTDTGCGTSYMSSRSDTAITRDLPTSESVPSGVGDVHRIESITPGAENKLASEIGTEQETKKQPPKRKRRRKRLTMPRKKGKKSEPVVPIHKIEIEETWEIHRKRMELRKFPPWESTYLKKAAAKKASREIEKATRAAQRSARAAAKAAMATGSSVNTEATDDILQFLTADVPASAPADLPANLPALLPAPCQFETGVKRPYSSAFPIDLRSDATAPCEEPTAASTKDTFPATTCASWYQNEKCLVTDPPANSSVIESRNHTGDFNHINTYNEQNVQLSNNTLSPACNDVLLLANAQSVPMPNYSGNTLGAAAVACDKTNDLALCPEQWIGAQSNFAAVPEDFDLAMFEF